MILVVCFYMIVLFYISVLGKVLSQPFDEMDHLVVTSTNINK